MLQVNASKSSDLPVLIKLNVLGFNLSSKQNVYVNYLLPSIIGCLFYVFLFAVDFVTFYRHLRDDNPIWASLTLLFLYMPVIGCFILIVSSWELWPELDGFSFRNIKWFMFKFMQHLFFPLWSMWR